MLLAFEVSMNSRYFVEHAPKRAKAGPVRLSCIRRARVLLRLGALADGVTRARANENVSGKGGKKREEKSAVTHRAAHRRHFF